MINNQGHRGADRRFPKIILGPVDRKFSYFTYLMFLCKKGIFSRNPLILSTALKIRNQILQIIHQNSGVSGQSSDIKCKDWRSIFRVQGSMFKDLKSKFRDKKSNFTDYMSKFGGQKSKFGKQGRDFPIFPFQS